ncbi:VOC family protein [Streptomyces sp. NPDC056480]|uniref:VOC family protein n=1 Tax=Streptomyces sp. NPDC056480 TaxID=3345833 RepID=UPI00367A79E5
MRSDETSLHAYLSYTDAAAAIDWLESVGFVTTVRQDDDAGRVIHAELRFGQAVIMLASADEPYAVPPLAGVSTGSGLYLATPSVDELHDRAVRSGGTSVIAPEDTAWGSRRARVLDPEGREWSFGTHRPGGDGSD